MKKLTKTTDKLAWLLTRHGLKMPEIKMIDASDAINRDMVRREVSFEVALAAWWQKHMTGYHLPIATCERIECAKRFIDYQERGKRFCCNSCKQSAENARWYERNAKQRKQDVSTYRRWAKDQGMPADFYQGEWQDDGAFIPDDPNQIVHYPDAAYYDGRYWHYAPIEALYMDDVKQRVVALLEQGLEPTDDLIFQEGQKNA